MAHKLHLSNGLSSQVRPPLLLSLILRQELTTEDRYPNNITSDTVVPAWAYLDVTATDKFEAASASNSKDLPGSTVGNYEASTSCPASPSNPSGSSQSNPINTLAIVGIAVGSTLGLGILVWLIICLLPTDKLLMPSRAFGANKPSTVPAEEHHPVPRHRGILLPSGPSSPAPEPRRPMLQVTGIHFDTNGTPYSPPPPTGTPLGTVDSASIGSMRCVRSRQADYIHVLICAKYRSTDPLMQNGQRLSGSTQPLYPLPEM